MTGVSYWLWCSYLRILGEGGWGGGGSFSGGGEFIFRGRGVHFPGVFVLLFFPDNNFSVFRLPICMGVLLFTYSPLLTMKPPLPSEATSTI